MGEKTFSEIFSILTEIKLMFLARFCAVFITSVIGSFKLDTLLEYLCSNGSMVECLTRDRGDVGSSLSGVTALWSLSGIQLS